MKKRSRYGVFRRNASLTLSERAYACRQRLINIWTIWLARAEVWQAWQEHGSMQAAMGPLETLDASEPFFYEDYFTGIEVGPDWSAS